jgi:hypothetical protein
MDRTQYAIVRDRINDLLREGEALRAERRVRGPDRLWDEDVGGSAGRHGPGRRPARVRLGHWLIGVGAALAGTKGDARRPI